MPNKKEIRKGVYLTYEDQQSLEETHDMVVKALPGQSYVLEPMHKVSTTQVTGEALKKVAVGGKGGFAAGTAGDVREKKKELNADGRLFVGPKHSQDYSTFNEYREKVLVGVRFPEGFDEALKGILIPRTEFHNSQTGLFSSPRAPKPISDIWEYRETRDKKYDDFAYQNSLDASDCHRLIEWAYREGYISKERLEQARETYEELCGYRGAWKYVGLDGSEHRRYEISIQNTINFANKGDYSGLTGFWSSKGNSYEPRAYHCHHTGLYDALNKYWRDGEDEEFLDEWMTKSYQSHAGFLMWKAEKARKEFWPVSNLTPFPVKDYPINKSKEASRVVMSEKYESIRQEIKDMTEYMYGDLKAVYRWEGTKQGKIKFLEANKAVRDDNWKCEDRRDRNDKIDYYKNLRK